MSAPPRPPDAQDAPPTPSPTSAETRRAALRAEVRPMLHLAAPVVASELAWMAMGLVDTLMVGRVSPVVLGAVGLGHAVFFAVAVLGIGVLLSLDYFVARAWGAGDRPGTVRHLVQGAWLGLLVSPPLMGLIYLAPRGLSLAGVDAEVVTAVGDYLTGLNLSLPFLMVYTAVRRYLQAVELARPVLWVLVAANLLNLGLDWALIFGHLGLPALGAAGAGWATGIGRVFLCGACVALAVCHARRTGIHGVSLRPDLEEIAALARLGLPAAGQLLLEVGMFSGATVLAGRMDPISLAAHQVAMQVASFTFMVPLGVSSAGAVRVGQAMGRGDPRGAAGAGWVALALGAGFMLASSVMLSLSRHALASVFSPDAEVIALGAALLVYAAVFQLFDALQVVGTGILRGLGETRTPMLANLVGHWLLGLPIGATLAFGAGWGVRGLWVGLCVGLSTVAVSLLAVWRRRTAEASSPCGA